MTLRRARGSSRRDARSSVRAEDQISNRRRRGAAIAMSAAPIAIATCRRVCIRLPAQPGELTSGNENQHEDGDKLQQIVHCFPALEQKAKPRFDVINVTLRD